MNENLRKQDYGEIFDQNHPNIEGDLLSQFLNLRLDNNEVGEQQESRRLRRRDTFIKLARAAVGFKSPAKANTEKSAQNDRELQIAIAESLAGQANSDKKFNKIVGIFESDCIPNFAKHYLSFNIIHPNPKEEFIDKSSAAKTPYTTDKLMETSLIDSNYEGMNGEQKRLKYQGIKSPNLSFLLKNNYNEKIGGRTIPSYQLLIYDDLLKCELGSDGKLTEKFVQDIRHGEDLMYGIMSGDLDIDNDVSPKDRVFLDSLITQLNSLYSQINHNEYNDNHEETDLETRIVDIVRKIKPNSRYSLSDRLVRMFFYYNGIRNADELLQIAKNKREYADRKNRKAKEYLDLNENDLIKLINPEVLPTVLENGILAKEYLGVGAKSDFTPMDTDFYGYKETLWDNATFKEYLFDSVGWTVWSEDDPYYHYKQKDDYLNVSEDDFCMLIVRKDDRFEDTTKKGGESLNIDKFELFFQGVFVREEDDYSPEELANYDKLLEYFSWCKRDFGVRTGLPSSEIDAIIVPDKKKGRGVINTVCNNSFYIPIYDANGKMVLSQKQYDEAKKAKLAQQK